MEVPWVADAIEDFSDVHALIHAGAVRSKAAGEGVCYPGPKLFPVDTSRSAILSLKC